MKKSYLIVVLLSFFFSNSWAGYRWEKADSKFTNISVRTDKSIPASQVEDGAYYMLIDLQSDIRTNQKFYHYAIKLTSENGVQNYSEIRVDYIPAYQKISINSLKVYRNNKQLEYRSKTKIKELQREEGLDNHIYDESLTLLMILEDVRVGDILEYSFTIEGNNPIFENFYYDSYSYQLNYTLLDFYLRIIKDKNQKLYIKNHNCDVQPSVVKKADCEEYVWQKSDIPGLITEKYCPSWYNPFPLIELSSCNNWGEIRNWGIRVFENNEPFHDSLRSVCEKISGENRTPGEKVIAALRFVQRNVRYLGIEIGVNSHKPHSQNKVFQLGYGDCKDKSLLLAKMLQYMDIEAYPALVSTVHGAHIKEFLPSPELFNHTVVKAKLNGISYWLDPTNTNQGGDIEHYYFTPYGNALVLNGNSSQLDTILTLKPSEISIKEFFTVKDMDGNANLNVITTYKGYDADDIRYTLATNSKQQLQENFLNFYKNNYLQIDTFGSLSWRDDTIVNEINIFEHYVIKDFWKCDDSANKALIRADVTAYDINNKISNYSKKYSSRKSPLFLEYPLHLMHTVNLVFPVEWNVETKNQRIDNEFFTFNYKTNYKDRTINLEYDLITKKDFVPASQSASFISDIEKVSKLMSFQLTYNKGESVVSSPIAWSRVMMLLMFIGVLGAILFKYYQKRKAVTSDSNPYETMGGWVILPLIGMFISPIMALVRLFRYNFFLDSLWKHNDSIMYQISITYEFLLQGLYIVVPIFLILIALRYDYKFPKFMIYFYISNIVANLIDISLVSSISDLVGTANYGDLGRAVLVAAVWIPYFIKSERCKRLFINGRSFDNDSQLEVNNS